MPEKIQLADGSEREVPTVEEIKSLQENAQKVEQERTAREAAEKKVKELEENADPNWKEARRGLELKEKLMEQLKAQGKTIDEHGTITDLSPKGPSVEDMTKLAARAARDEVLNAHKESLLNRYSKEEREAVEFYFKKFSTGEDLSLEKIDKFIADADSLVRPKQAPSDPRYSMNGAPPRMQPKTTPSDDALKFARAFGNNPDDLSKVDEPIIKFN
jgi:hypothetical protein